MAMHAVVDKLKRPNDEADQEIRSVRARVSPKDGGGGVEALRKASRQNYLMRRAQKKIEELPDDIADEESLFQGFQLTEAEYRDLNFKKEVCKIAKRRSEHQNEGDECYTMPDAYDLHGNINQTKRFSAPFQRYAEPSKEKPIPEQEAWENHQMKKAIAKFGSKEKNSDTHYDYVFEDQIKFVKGPETEPSSRAFAAKTKYEKFQEERENLPVFSYKGQFLQAVHDHQVLVLVGETGSGKTTQIPQYLYEAGYTSHGKIACTQPRRVAAMSVAARVSREMGVKLGHEVGYTIRFEDCTSSKTVVKYMTDGMLLREFLVEPDLRSYSVLMIDEAHERTVSTDILFGLVKDLVRYRPELKLLISSATLDAKKFSDYFDSAPVFIMPGRRFPHEIYYTTAPEADYLDAAIVTALEIHVKEPVEGGDILIFLTGQEEIEAAEDMLKHRTRKLRSKIPEMIICPIYANLPTDMQAKIFEPTPEGSRKIVLATNIAETSLTIDGISYVIDPGFCKTKNYDPRTGMESLLVTPISKASANQRAGRSGRTGPGKCFRLYTHFNYLNDLEDDSVPEIQRTDLASVVLTLKGLGINDILNFDFMDPPPSESLLKALELLYALNAIDKRGKLTKIGENMTLFPLEPMLSKMIVVSEEYKCSNEIITIAAMLSVGNSIFYRPKDKKLLADSAHTKFSAGEVGDHIALLKLYNGWTESWHVSGKETIFSSQWCMDNFVQLRSLKRARDIREQLLGLLDSVGIGLSSNPNDLEAIKKCILAGFFPNTARLGKNGYYSRVKNRQTVYLHPSSSMALLPPRWVVYHELVLTNKEYMRQVTQVKPEWLVEIAPHYYQLKDVKADEPKKNCKA